MLGFRHGSEKCRCQLPDASTLQPLKIKASILHPPTIDSVAAAKADDSTCLSDEHDSAIHSLPGSVSSCQLHPPQSKSNPIPDRSWQVGGRQHTDSHAINISRPPRAVSEPHHRNSASDCLNEGQFFRLFSLYTESGMPRYLHGKSISNGALTYGLE